MSVSARPASQGSPSAGDTTRLTVTTVALTAVATLIVYLCFLPATSYWLDSPEFIAAASNLGLPHPPGHPSMVILLKLFLLLPVGDASFRANLFSAVFAAVAAGLTAGISRIMAADVQRRVMLSGTGRAAPVMVGITSGLLFAGCRSAFIQSMAAEVYTFNAVLILGALFVLLAAQEAGRRSDDARFGMMAGALVGLALANHHLLAILAFPAILAAFWKDRSSIRPLVWATVAASFVTAGCYLYMPVRALAGAWPAWASVSTWDGFVWYASAAIFSGSVGGFEQAGSSLTDNFGLAFVLLIQSLGALVPLLALCGLYQNTRTRSFRLVAVVCLMMAGSMASKVMMGILDPVNPDDHGYFLLAMSAISILAGQILLLPIGARFSGASGRRRALTAATMLGLVLAAAAIWTVWRQGVEVGAGRSQFDDTDAVASAVWDDIPTGAAAFVSHYPVFFLLQYQQEVEGARPDVTLIQESLYYKARGGRWYASMMAVRDETLKPLVSRFLSTGSIAWSDVASLARLRPVMLEASPDFQAVPADVSFAGWFFHVSQGPSQSESAARARSFASDMNFRFAWRTAANVETRRVVIRNLASSADWMEKSGNLEGAKALYAGALKFNPADRILNMKVSGDAAGRPSGTPDSP